MHRIQVLISVYATIAKKVVLSSGSGRGTASWAAGSSKTRHIWAHYPLSREKEAMLYPLHAYTLCTSRAELGYHSYDR